MKKLWVLFSVLLALPQTGSGDNLPFRFPTANKALLQPDGGEQYFVGTAGKPWMSGTFGCVRSEGWQLHEGIDIRCLERDPSGEPTDPILATASGTVAYANSQAGLSNYGKYIVLRHQIEGLEIFSTYAHLSAIAPGLEPGRRVKAGQVIGTMGRTANTRQRITQDRAHLHFEINFLMNDRFPQWYAENFPGQRNDHGLWNGQNLIGVDAALIFQEQERNPDRFSFLEWVRNQEELFRVQVRRRDFPWVRHYTRLIQRNPVAEREGLAGFELVFNYYGLPFLLIPRASSEMRGNNEVELISVHAAVQEKNPCRDLVSKTGGKWQLTRKGRSWIELLTY